MARELIILDVSSYIFRAYHALPPLTNRAGEQVNAIYGFITMFTKLAKRFGDFKVVAALDSGRATFRREAYSEYKANRKEIDPELKEQFKHIEPMLKALNVHAICAPGFEADDIIATLKAHYSDDQIIIVTGDKDLMQLVDERTSIYDSMKARMIGIAEVIEKFEVPPEKVRDFLALTGDSSDNVPGLPGVGPKTAAKLLKEFSSIEDIYDNLDKLNPGLKKKFEDNRKELELSRMLVSLRSDVPFSGQLVHRWEGVDREQFAHFATEHDFGSLIKQLGLEKEAEEAVRVRRAAAVPNTFESIFDMAPAAPQPEAIRFSAGTVDFTGIGDYYLTRSNGQLFIGSGGRYAPATAENLPKQGTLYLFESKDYADCTGEAKQVDLQLAAYTIDSGRHGYSREDIAKRYALTAETEDVVAAEFEILTRIKQTVMPQIDGDERRRRLFYEIEMPHMAVVRLMETAGIAVNLPLLRELHREFSERLIKIGEEITVWAGGNLNVNSPKQLAEVLFTRLGLPAQKKGKTGPSTDHAILEELSAFHPLPGLILEHRKFQKLLTTYIEPIERLTGTDGRLHTTFHITHTATGRLASREPNLQNIPVRTEEGRKIRSLFVAGSGRRLISLDYSQIELRILAALSKDEALLEAFRNGEDIHRKTASAIFNIFPEFVDETMRRHAKAVNFGIIYGMQAFKLSQDTGVQIAFAKEYIENYFRFYKGVKQYIERTIAAARQSGYVETLMGRRRTVEELLSSNKTIAKQGERMAVNTTIQGSAADVIKAGTLLIHRYITEKKLDAKILLQIHDELVIEVPDADAEALAEEFARILTHAAPDLPLPLTVNWCTGYRWDELK